MAFTYAGQYTEAILATGSSGATLLPSLPAHLYTVGTTTHVTLYTSRTKGTTTANPVTSDVNGNVTFFADPGQYDVVFTPTGGSLKRVTVTVPVDPAEASGTYVPRATVLDRGLWCSPNGDDVNNDGLSMGTALKTITAAIAKADAVNAGVEINLAQGQHFYGATDGTGGGSTIRVRSNLRIKGIGSADAGVSNNGSVIVRTVDDGNPMFDSAPGAPLAGFVAEDFQIITQLAAKPTPSATAHGFKLYCLTNNSALRRIEGQRLRGDVVNLNANVTTGDTVHAAFNAELAQIFGVACGGYNINATGQMVATIRQPDGTNMEGGLIRVSGGASNQAALVIEQPMWEGGTTTASLQPILLDNMNSQFVIIIGGCFTGAASSTDVVKATTTSAMPVLLGCEGYNFTNWINDVPAGFLLPMTTGVTYHSGAFNAGAMVATGLGAFMEVWDLNGTANQRRFRWSVSGNILVLREYNDSGVSVRDVLYVNGSTGQITSVTDHAFSAKVGFNGTTPIAKPTVTGSRSANAALASLLTALASYGIVVDSSSA